MTASRPSRPSGRGSRLRGAAVVLLGVGAAQLIGPFAAPASAHDDLVGSSPTSGAALPTAPATVELELSGTPLPLGTEVLVTGPDGSAVSEGPAGIRGGTVVQQLSDGLPAGAYTVRWRSTSSDGHPLSGSYGFTVSAGTASAAAPAPVGTDGATGPRPDGSGPPVAWAAAAAVGLGALGLLARGRLRGRA
ncbi:copper resistance CopC family protein [Blastococcus montanus]|uniref:copper resistance CopC family protein n=1 Tax=Blastococcus montanus TaxID=3144973 RepID=UPI003208B364